MVVEDLVRLPEGGKQVDVGHPLSLQIGDQPVDVVLPLQRRPHMGQVLRIENTYIYLLGATVTYSLAPRL